jgi:inosine/xanthosine triphosphate pyrophosphatase family protein
LLAATRNPAKLAELRRLVEEQVTVDPLPNDISQQIGDEAGGTIEEIASGKAVTVSRHVAGQLVIASDGGLLVPALGDAWQPVFTRRFAGERGDDLTRAIRLLEMATHLRGAERSIGWREAVAVARDGALLTSWSAESAPGTLATTVAAEQVEAGGGFWIPAIWRCPELGGRVLAELSADERNRRDDHWRRLAAPVRAWLARQEAL